MSRKGFGGPKPTPPRRGVATELDGPDAAVDVDDPEEEAELPGDVARDPARQNGE